MIKLIVGTKGSGKTKTLIDMAKAAAETSKGNVVCVEKGDKLAREVPTSVRLINSDEYQVKGFANLYGFLAGILAGNYDITHLFVDGTFKIGKVGEVEKDYEGLAALVEKLSKVQSDAEIIFTVSCDVADLPITMKDFIVQQVLMTLKGHAERRVLFCPFSESTKAVLRFGFVRDGSFSARRSLGRLSLHAVRLRRKDRQREEKTEVFCQTFVHKSLWVSKGQSPWSHSAECDTPYRQAHF